MHGGKVTMTWPQHKVKQSQGSRGTGAREAPQWGEQRVGSKEHRSLQVTCHQQRLLSSPSGQASSRARPIGQSELPPLCSIPISQVPVDTRSRQSAQAISNPRPQHRGSRSPQVTRRWGEHQSG